MLGGEYMSKKIKEESWYPSAKQVKVVGLLLDIESCFSKSEVCTKARVSPKTLGSWFEDHDFVAFFNAQIALLVKGAVGDVWQALIRKASSGDVSAMKLFFELTGKYKERKEVTGKAPQLCLSGVAVKKVDAISESEAAIV